MNCERLVVSSAVSPQSLTGGSDVTTSFVDMNNRVHYSFLVQVGALAGGKGVKVALLGANVDDGTGAAVIGDTTYTAQESGSSGRMIAVRGRVTPEFRYLAVRVSNLDAASATTAAVALVSDGLHVPDDSGITVLQV